MRKRKRKTLKYMRLSLLCFGLHACSLFLEPFAINGENEMTTAGYALGGIFWASFLAGTVLFEICRRNLSGDAGYREWKQKKVPGIFGFCGSDPVTVNGHHHREQSDGKHPGGASSGGSGCYGIHFLSAHDGKWQSLQIYDTK